MYTSRGNKINLYYVYFFVIYWNTVIPTKVGIHYCDCGYRLSR